MANIKLFNLDGTEYPVGKVTLEKELQTIIEKNMDTFFGVTFLASEYCTTDGGRMDSIGIDENNCPVIFEYKRSVNENVINQGLFYLNWLLDHKDSFKVLVINKLGLEKAEKIDWSMPRVVCVAGDFNRYDESAIKQMIRNISLIRYKKFGENLLLFEQLNENTVKAIQVDDQGDTTNTKQKPLGKSFAEHKKEAPQKIVELYDNLNKYIRSLGDDITETELKFYVAYKKIKNFVCVELFNTKLLLHIRLDVDTVDYEEGFSRNTSKIGHYGTGDVEITIKDAEDYEKAKGYIERAYEEN